MPKISFISANYVARALDYRGPSDWMAHDAATIRAASAEHFAGIAADVAAAGFENIDIWTAHCHWQHHADGDYIEIVKGICSQYDLAITSYAGGMWGADPAAMAPHIQKICERLNVRYGLENHPEKSVEEILAKIGGGQYSRIGVALDTGWCGTHSLDALEAARRLREKV